MVTEDEEDTGSRYSLYKHASFGEWISTTPSEKMYYLSLHKEKHRQQRRGPIGHHPPKLQDSP